MNKNENSYPRSFMARCIYAWLFCILVYFFLNNSLLSQLSSPVLTTIESDNTYWLLHFLNIPQFLLKNHWAALSFDVIVTTSCLTFVFLPDKTIFAWITVTGCWLLYVCYCTAAGHHFAQIGYLIAPIAFIVKSEIKFELLWKLIRYWICFLYVSGGLYKIYYGGFGSAENMAEILRQMNTTWLFFNPEGTSSGFIYALINKPELAQWLFRFATVVDLMMIIGFFTYKFDRWLLAGLVLFHAANYFMLHISFVEQSLIFAPFLPWKQIASRIINSDPHD
jgi:hypothetical protein